MHFLNFWENRLFIFKHLVYGVQLLSNMNEQSGLEKHFLIRKYAFQPSVFGTEFEVRGFAQTNAENAMPKITWGRGEEGAGKAAFLSLVDSNENHI